AVAAGIEGQIDRRRAGRRGEIVLRDGPTPARRRRGDGLHLALLIYFQDTALLRIHDIDIVVRINDERRILYLDRRDALNGDRNRVFQLAIGRLGRRRGLRQRRRQRDGAVRDGDIERAAQPDYQQQQHDDQGEREPAPAARGLRLFVFIIAQPGGQILVFVFRSLLIAPAAAASAAAPPLLFRVGGQFVVFALRRRFGQRDRGEGSIAENDDGDVVGTAVAQC